MTWGCGSVVESSLACARKGGVGVGCSIPRTAKDGRKVGGTERGGTGREEEKTRAEKTMSELATICPLCPFNWLLLN